MVTADNLLEELRQRLVRLVPSLNANELDMALKEVGKGLLNECAIREATDIFTCAADRQQ
jgi:hypothetical protein